MCCCRDLASPRLQVCSAGGRHQELMQSDDDVMSRSVVSAGRGRRLVALMLPERPESTTNV